MHEVWPGHFLNFLHANRSKNMFGRVFVGTPTWPNHAPLIASSGVEMVPYPYYDKASTTLQFDRMMDAFGQAEAGDLVLLHGCCHNPTGADLSADQWQAVADLVSRRGLIPFVAALFAWGSMLNDGFQNLYTEPLLILWPAAAIALTLSGCAVGGGTLERITLPDDLVARLEGKSSLGRLGLLIHSTAGFIDAGGPPSGAPGGKTSLGLDSNVGAMACYIANFLCCLGVVLSIVFLITEKENRFVKFHALQSLFLWGVCVVLLIVVQILTMFLNIAGLHFISFAVGWGLWGILILIFALLWILAGIKAYGGQWYKLPGIGSVAFGMVNK